MILAALLTVASFNCVDPSIELPSNMQIRSIVGYYNPAGTGRWPIDEWESTSQRGPVLFNVPDLRPIIDNRIGWLPTTPSTIPGRTTYKVRVDNSLRALSECFEETVDSILADPRSWRGVVPATEGETPQFWVTLRTPGAACDGLGTAATTCAYTSEDLTGEFRFNYVRWVKGYGYDDMSLFDQRAMIINHEVGHILGFGHYDCSVMGTPRWVEGAGYPSWDTEWDNCDPIAWPSAGERATAATALHERRPHPNSNHFQSE